MKKFNVKVHIILQKIMTQIWPFNALLHNFHIFLSLHIFKKFMLSESIDLFVLKCK